MNEQDILNLIQQTLTQNQYKLNATGFHVHNQTDGTPKIPFINLSDTPVSYSGNAGKVATVNPTETGLEFDTSGGGGSVTSVSVVTANGVSGSVATATTTPAITLTLGAITPSKVTAIVTIQTVVAVAAQAFDGTAGNVFTRTLAASETFTQSGFTTGQCFMCEVKQGSGTAYTVTWWSGITWVTVGATAPVQTVVTNGYTTYGFRCTGSNTFLGYLVGTN